MKALHEKLIDSGLITKKEVDQVRSLQRKSGWKIVEYLMHQGRLNENELIDFISRELKIDKYTPEKYPLDKTAKDTLPEAVARKQDLVPLCLNKGVLIVATADPESINRLDVVERVTGHEIPIPESIQGLLSRQKQSKLIKPDYAELKGYLMGK